MADKTPMRIDTQGKKVRMAFIGPQGQITEAWELDTTTARAMATQILIAADAADANGFEAQP